MTVGLTTPSLFWSVARVQELWESLVGVLHANGHPTSALLCTTADETVAAYGLSETDLRLTSQRTGRLFAARTHSSVTQQAPAEDAIEILEITTGQQHTVIASVPGSPTRDHLLSVTAEGVSLPLLQAWTRCAAEDLGELLSDQPSPSSSLAAE